MREEGKVAEEFIFEKLNVYKKSLDLSIEVCKLCSDFNFKYSRIRDQFIGAIISIPLNIAEGNGRNTNKDKINFYKIARSSSFECIPIIDICFNMKLISESEREELRRCIWNISKMLSGLVKYQSCK